MTILLAQCLFYFVLTFVLFDFAFVKLDTRENAMVSTLHQHTMGRRKRLNIVRKSGISQANEQVVDNSNDVNQNNHDKNEVCANFRGGIKFLLAPFIFSSVLKFHSF